MPPYRHHSNRSENKTVTAAHVRQGLSGSQIRQLQGKLLKPNQRQHLHKKSSFPHITSERAGRNEPASVRPSEVFEHKPLDLSQPSIRLVYVLPDLTTGEHIQAVASKQPRKVTVFASPTSETPCVRRTRSRHEILEGRSCRYMIDCTRFETAFLSFSARHARTALEHATMSGGSICGNPFG